MVDVVRDDRPAGGHRRAHLLDVAVLAQCDELHLAGDLTAAGIGHLGDALALRGAQRGSLLAAPLFAGCAALGCPGAIVQQVALAALVLFDVAAVADPLAAQCGQPHLRLRVGAAGAVDLDRLVGAGGGIVQVDRGLGYLETVDPQGCVAVLRVNFGRVNICVLRAHEELLQLPSLVLTRQVQTVPRWRARSQPQPHQGHPYFGTAPTIANASDTQTSE